MLIIVGDASETVDTLYPYYRLPEDEFEPVVAGPEKRRYHLVMHEIPDDWDGHVTREFEGGAAAADTGAGSCVDMLRVAHTPILVVGVPLSNTLMTVSDRYDNKTNKVEQLKSLTVVPFL